ncbi:hypothetical protein B0T21DRAFT_413251 [Apiosordaria backusii]|uniref:Uncharacterized protein n=1 Tax=Apiosordaria backusii TaxID=314023 RepID=A0AA40E6V4_9PEZI|nr:hypothetical protein B0T21DRAFT_413251 [Apiosordaria backusii]
MEPIHTTRRSASHGALNRSYPSTSDSLHRPRPVHSRQQLRSVNENTSLLVSPGPLESMLKTTTETGDIGLFSIRPVRSSGNFHAPSSRRKPGHGETPLGRRPNGDGMRSYSLRDDRRWLPSYRDTTSEIISMYGSDSLRSASSAFTPPYNDMGNRSYSMTTCSSRRPPSQKPTGDMQSQQHEAFLQRPRSPFPYPTRLKRPGVRPASPAWTENGAVDYSKMVGIDRVSRRTVHGSYKPTYPQYGNRQMPRPRIDGTSSSESFSNYGVADKYSLHCGLSPISPAPWDHRYRGRLESSASEHSLRTSSITSILNMYQRSTCGPPTRNPSLRVQPPGTFYYDYSEGFDYTTDSPPPLPDFPSHVATRSSSVHSPPRVIDTEHNSGFQGLDKYHRSPSGHKPYSEGKLSSPRPQSQNSQSFDSQSLGDQQNAQDVPRETSGKVQSSADTMKEYSRRFETGRSPLTFKAGVNSQGSSGDEMLAGSRGAGMAYSPRYDDEEWSIGTAVVHRRQNANLTVRSHLQFSSPRSLRVVTSRSCEENMRRLAASPPRPSPLSGSTHRSLPAHYRERRAVSSSLRGEPRRSKFYPVDLGDSGLASTEDRLDGGTSTDTQDGLMTLEDSMDRQGTAYSSLPDQTHDKTMICGSPYAKGPASEVGQQFVGHSYMGDSNPRGHRRNFAVPAIDTNDLQNLVESDIDSIVGRSRTPMLAPHPISPARQLRLQNSVPQLMKALPPLPGISVRSESCIANFSSQDLEYIMGFPSTDPSCFGVDQATMVDPALSYDSNPQEPRFKMPSSPIVTSPLAYSMGPDELMDHGAPIHIDQREQPRRSGSRNSKLKLKVSRGALNKMHAEGNRGRRNTVAGPTREWSGPVPKLRGQPSMSHLNPGLANMDCLVESAGETEKTDTCDQEDAFLDSPSPNTPVPPIPDRHQDHCGNKLSPDTQVLREVISPAARSEARSSLSQDSCVSAKSPRGLKKRFSDLRVRLAESRLRSAETLHPGGRIGEVIEVVNIPPVEAPMTESGDGSKADLTRRDGDGDNNASDQEAGKHQARGFRGRMSRWFKTARQVVMGACSGSGKRG